jgi:hypothetical protein
MKFLSISAFLTLVALQVAAGPTSVSSYDTPKPSERPQVLWGQCQLFPSETAVFSVLILIQGGGYYYYGTTVCPPGAYCRYFSDCKHIPPIFLEGARIDFSDRVLPMQPSQQLV